jgi:glyoxylase-like metal-dependent hydrolase (beta-lactamase superfamily II)
LVVGTNESLVVDTLYDVNHALEFLEAIRPVTTQAPVQHVFNTHSDGDHIFGNQVFPIDAQVIATNAAAAEMTQEQADLTASAFDDSLRPESPLHALAELARPFDFHSIRVRPPDATFSGEHAIQLTNLDIELYELGPAHTVGDAIAYLPEKEVLFAGDLLTRDIVKVVWSGSLTNWISALRTIRGLAPQVVIPGHGPLLVGPEIDDAIQRGIAFWSYLHESAQALYSKGVPPDEAVGRINIDDYPDAALTLPTIIAAAYHDLDPGIDFKPVPETLQFMASEIVRKTTS